MFKSVVVGADDSSTARQAVIAAAEIAQLAGGKLHIVTAMTQGVRTDDLPVEFRELGNVNPADALLEGLAKIAAQRGLEPIVHASKGGAAEAIIGVAEQEDADLIVVGNKGMKGVRRVLAAFRTRWRTTRRARCSSSTRTKPAEPRRRGAHGITAEQRERGCVIEGK